MYFILMSRSWLLHSLLFHTSAMSYWIIRQNSLASPNDFLCLDIELKSFCESNEPQLGMKEKILCKGKRSVL